MRTIKRDIVGAFIFSSDDQILLVQSSLGGVYPDIWVVAGGGIEPGETNRQAVIREVAEELGMDISQEKLVQAEKAYTGESQKTLRDTGETVLVKMNFIDFIVHLDAVAADVKFKAQDDIGQAQWFPLAKLNEIKLGPGPRQQLIDLGYKL